MPSSKVFVVAAQPDSHGLLPLSATEGGRVTVSPGRYLLKARRYGLGDPLLVGSSDRVSAALIAGKATVAASAHIAHASKIDQALRRLDGEVDLDPGETLALGMSLVIDRGKPPEAVQGVIKNALGKLPDSSAALVAGALAGSLSGLGLAVAVALVTKGVTLTLDSLFGDHVLLSEKGTLAGGDGPPGLTLCLLSIPKSPHFGLKDFGVEPGTSLLYETLRDRSTHHESRTHRGHTRSKDFAYAVVTLERA